MAFIANQGKIQSTMAHILEDIPSPACEAKPHLLSGRHNLTTQNGADDGGRVVCRCNPEGTMFCLGVECRTSDQPVQPRQHDLKLLQHAFALWRWLITLCCPDQQIIVK